MTDRREIEEDVVSQLVIDLGDMSLAGLPVPLSVTTDGSTTTLIDSKLGRGTRDANAYDGRIIKFTGWDTDGAAVESIHGVTDGGYNAGSNTLSFLPALATAPDAAQEYIMYPRGVGPEKVLRALQRTLRLGEAPHVDLLSILQSPSFEYSSGSPDHTAMPLHWNQVGTVTTSTLGLPSATASPTGLFGHRLRVVTAAATSGIKSDPINVQEGEKFLISVHAVAGVQALTISLHDETADAEIASVILPSTPSALDGDVLEARFTATAPSSCKKVSVRIIAASNDTFDILAPVVLQSQTGRLMSVAANLYREEQIKEWFQLPTGAPAPVGTTGAYQAYSGGWLPYDAPQIIRHEIGRVSGVNVFDTGGIAGDKKNTLPSSPLRFPLVATDNPVGLVYMRSFEDAGVITTSGSLVDIAADREWAVAQTLANLGIPGWQSQATARARVMGYGGHELRMQGNPRTPV